MKNPLVQSQKSNMLIQFPVSVNVTKWLLNVNGDRREPKRSFMAKYRQKRQILQKFIIIWLHMECNDILAEYWSNKRTRRHKVPHEATELIFIFCHFLKDRMTCSTQKSFIRWSPSVWFKSSLHMPRGSFCTTLSQFPLNTMTPFHCVPTPIRGQISFYSQKLHSHSAFSQRDNSQKTNKLGVLHHTEHLPDNGVKDWKYCWLSWDRAIWMKHHVSRRVL